MGVKMINDQQIRELIHTAIDPLGIELVDVQIVGSGGRTIVRVYVDEPGGISIERCSSASREISEVFERQDPISARYTLEVSSPGVHRPLVTERDYRRHINRLVEVIYMTDPEAKPLAIRGRILDVKDSLLTLDVDGETAILDIAKIKKSKIVLEFK